MQPDELINKFIKVIQNQDYVFNEKAIKDIPSLQTNLESLENENLNSESLAATIYQWYINHPSVRDAVLSNEREISKVKKSNPASGEAILQNRYRIQQGLEKIQEKNQESKEKQ
ncbi:MAG: hypothetical protein AAFV71_25820 [Cyanobacteria bacterium J06633_8]